MITLYFGRIFIVSLIACFVLIWDFKFFGWINILPIILLFFGLFVGGHMPTDENSSQLLKYRYIVCRLLAPVFIIILLLDRFGDIRTPIVVPARFLCFNRSNFLASATVSVVVTYSDGTEIDFPVRASAFASMPIEGTRGKAMIGRGLFGVSYIQRVEFDGYTR